MIKVGLLGCGNVGHIIAMRHVDVTITAVYDVVFDRAVEISKICNAKAYQNFDEFLGADVDLVVEAASVSAVRNYGEAILARGHDLVVLSVGALADKEFRETLEETATRTGSRVYIPSGAIIGLDNLKIGQITPIQKLLLRTTKNPQSLGIDADRRMLVFKGKANDCIRQFPKNINVAVALELAAGRDADVELWVDPSIERNIHEVFAEGDFGEIEIKVSNTPSPDNPATSYLAALSVLTLLKNIKKPIVIGT